MLSNLNGVRHVHVFVFGQTHDVFTHTIRTVMRGLENAELKPAILHLD